MLNAHLNNVETNFLGRCLRQWRWPVEAKRKLKLKQIKKEVAVKNTLLTRLDLLLASLCHNPLELANCISPNN